MSGTEPRTRRFGLTLKVFTATALVVVAVLGAILVLVTALARSNADAALDERLAVTSEVVRDFIEAENRRLAAGAAAAAQNSFMLANVIAGSGADVLDQATEYRAILGADYTLITDRQGVLRARTDRPGVAGDTLADYPLVGIPLSGTQVAGYVNQADERLYLAVSTPLKDLASEVVQAVLLSAQEVTDSLAEHIRRATGSHIVFYVFDGDRRPVVVASTLDRTPQLDSAVGGAVSERMRGVAGNEQMRAEARWGEQRLVGFNQSLTNPGAEQAMGGYLALRSLDVELARFRRLQRNLLITGGAGLLLALVAALLVARRIAGPVRALVGATRRVAEGDYAAEVPAGSNDEVGDLALAFRHMVEELKAKQQLVEYLSSSASSAVTQPVYTAGGDVASATMVRSVAGATGMLAVGQSFGGRYEIKSMLGMGGMGVVYRALDRELGEMVAIKTLKGDAMAADPALLQRFKDEIRLARKITHRNVVRTHDLGEVEGMYYITMEFVEGQSLKHLIQSRGNLPVNVVLTVGKQLCRALEVAHEQGVIHRDIKPQNLIVEPSGVLKVMDFGIARLVTRKDGVTQAGMAIGTPEYMAPEQLLGDNVDTRADLYAAGCVLFECLCGRPPFVADSPITLVAKQLEELPPSPRTLNAEVPEPLAQLILATLSKDAARRPQSATALFAALDSVAA